MFRKKYSSLTFLSIVIKHFLPTVLRVFTPVTTYIHTLSQVTDYRFNKWINWLWSIRWTLEWLDWPVCSVWLCSSASAARYTSRRRFTGHCQDPLQCQSRVVDAQVSSVQSTVDRNDWQLHCKYATFTSFFSAKHLLYYTASVRPQLHLPRGITKQLGLTVVRLPRSKCLLLRDILS